MRFSVFYLKNPVLGPSLNHESHTRVSTYLSAEDATAVFKALAEDTMSDNLAGNIARSGLRRFSPIPGDILVSEEGDVIRKTRDSIETLGVTPHTLRLLLHAAPLNGAALDSKLERCSFGTLKTAFAELARKTHRDLDEAFPPEEELPF